MNQQQSCVFQVGPDFQGSDDDDGGGGSIGPSLNYTGIFRRQSSRSEKKRKH